MIRVNLDVMLARRKMTSGELADALGITQANLSILKTNKGRAIRFSTLDAICRILGCQVADIDAGHAVNLENPEEFNAAVLAFLRTLPETARG